MTEQSMNRELTPEDAQALLAEDAKGPVVTRSDRTRLVASLAGLGVLVGASLPALAASIGNADAPRALRFSLGGMVLAIMLFSLFSMVVNLRKVSAYPRGFARIYLWGMLGTMALYTVGLVAMMTVQDGDVVWPMWVVALIGLLVAVPAVIGAWRLNRLDAR